MEVNTQTGRYKGTQTLKDREGETERKQRNIKHTFLKGKRKGRRARER